MNSMYLHFLDVGSQFCPLKLLHHDVPVINNCSCCNNYTQDETIASSVLHESVIAEMRPILKMLG